LLQGTDLHFCRANTDGSPDEALWIYRGVNEGEAAGLWGRFVPNRGDSPRRRDWRETYLDDIQSDLAIAALRTTVQAPKPISPQLKPGFFEPITSSISERHQAYSSLFGSWELSEAHRQQLSRRYGFPITDANARLLGSISVGPGTVFLHSGTFPGCTGTNVLRFHQSAVALSITDEQQRILGVELRLDDPAGGGRYRWLSRPNDCELGIPEYDGENPLGIFAPVCGQQLASCTSNDLIGISEGRGMKPRICANRWGFPVIGGGGHAAATGAPIQLNRYLQLNRGAVVLLLVDAGGLKNPRVVQHIARNAAFCRQRGHQVFIPWWGQEIAKQDPDPDEVPCAVTGLSYTNGQPFIQWDDWRNVPLWTPAELGLEA
jgi:hypothetical protein